MRNRLLCVILIAVLSVSMLVQAAGEINLDKDIFVVETNIDAIMKQGSHDFFGYQPVTDEFLFWVAHDYGEDVLKKIAENKNYSDPEVWFQITGKSIYVLYDEYASFVGMDAWDYSHVHRVEKEGDVSFVFSGDVTIHEGAATTNHMDEVGGIDKCFSSDLMEIMQGADVFVVNNEFCYSTRGEPTPGKDYTFRADPRRVEALKELGTDLACLANNHVFDYGADALTDTLQILRDADMPYIGAGENLQEAERIQYYIAGGRKIAIVNATQIERSTTFTREATATQSGVFKTLHPENCVRAIRRAKRNADLCLVSVHWGTEGNEYYGGDQVSLANAFVEAGADAIIGGHTHCLEGIEYIGDVPVFYSLGNYWFSTSANMPGDYDTGLAVIKVSQDGRITPSFVPARFHVAVTSLLTGDEALRVYGYLESVSQTTSIDKKGKIKRR
ncbi:MAG: CapA family protein [Lachnospiraceae bacterium]|nr:CapA family protein [Lachnospiraceae bacterium]